MCQPQLNAAGDPVGLLADPSQSSPKIVIAAYTSFVANTSSITFVCIIGFFSEFGANSEISVFGTRFRRAEISTKTKEATVISWRIRRVERAQRRSEQSILLVRHRGLGRQLRVATFCFRAISIAVHRFRIVAALLLLAIWVPSSSHELLEGFGLIHVQASPSGGDSHENDHDAADGLCQLPGWSLQVQKYQAADISFLLPVAFAACLQDGIQARACFALVNPSPPDIPVSWQFSFRAALPARAPSLIS